MANPRMICFFLPLREEAVAAQVRQTLHDPYHRSVLDAACQGIEWLHFASFALLPPHPGEPPGGPGPSLMIELAVDEGVSPDAVLAGVQYGDVGRFIERSLRLPLAGLRDGLHVADGGFVGVRDRTAARIKGDVRIFLGARAGWTPDPAATRAENAASAPAAPGAWRAEPRSLWRQPWMNAPLRALAIVFALFASPLRAAGFGPTALLAACTVSTLILWLVVILICVVWPALMLALLGIAAAAQALVLAVLSFWPYQGIVAIGVGTLLGGPVLWSAACLAMGAVLTVYGWKRIVPLSLAYTAGLLAASRRVRDTVWPAVDSLLSEGMQEIMRLLAPTFAPGRTFVQILVVPLALLAGAFFAVMLILTLTPVALVAAVGFVLARAFGTLRPAALATTSLVVIVLGIGAWQHWGPAPPAQVPAVLGAAGWAIIRLTLAGMAAVALVGLGVLIAALSGRAASRAPGLGPALILAAFCVLAILFLPRPASPATSALVLPGSTAFLALLLTPAAILLTLAATHYRQWDRNAVVALAASAAFAGLASMLVAACPPGASAEAWLAAAFAGATLLAWLFRLAMCTEPSRAPGLLWPPAVLAAALAAWLAWQGPADVAWALQTPRPALALAALAYLGLAIDYRERAELIAAPLAGLAGALFMAWLIAHIGTGGRFARAGVVLASLIAVGATAGGYLVLSRALRRMAFGPSDARDLAGLLSGIAAAGLGLGLLALTYGHPAIKPPWFAVGTWLTDLAPVVHEFVFALLGAAMLYLTTICSVSLGALSVMALSGIAASVLAVAVAGTVLASVAGFDAGPAQAWLALHWHPSPLSAWLGRHPDDFVGLVARIALPFAGVVILYTGYVAMGVPARWLAESNTPQKTDIPRAKLLHPSIMACEANLAGRMQHMISVTEVRKPVWLFAPFLRYVLWVINTVGRIWCTEGRLGEAPGIHFGHWHVIDGGRRLVFCSNFEVPFGGYLDDFIRGTPDGTSLVWQCTELRLREPACAMEPGVEYPRAFPPTRLGIFGGCRNEQWFKSFARDSMVPHCYRYSAYDHTRDIIERAADFLALRSAPAAAAPQEEEDAAGNDRILRALE